jgi:vancomycin resistance protein YoaR
MLFLKGVKIVKGSFWFLLGALIGFFFFTSFLFIIYQKDYKNFVYSGVFVDGIDFSGKSKDDVRNYFAIENQKIGANTIQLNGLTSVATISGKQIDFGYDADLLANQAFSIGRSENGLTNLSSILQAYFNQIHLPAAYHYSQDKLEELVVPLKKEIDLAPVNALFTFQNGRVSAFSLSSDGRALDSEKLQNELYERFKSSILDKSGTRIVIDVPIKTLKPAVTDENANSLGISELIGEGTSLFYHSIENRIFNLSLAAARLNGVLIAPGEEFSFDKAVGDISSFTGYKQAYVIQNGRTVLGDGGGVCQVSTTLFRAALAAGLPITERHQHAYRVGYYEEDSGPGIDAAVYSPSVDLKFKNDTGGHILIQSYVDRVNMRITFQLYGTKDGREVNISTPVILSQSPAPEPLYQDDPNLPKGEIKQVDFAAAGANVYFTRSVKKDGKITISDKFVSNYRPWQAVFLRGTKE